MFAMGAILPTILMILVFTVMPESPRWLVQKERYDEAKAVLKQIYGPGMVKRLKINIWVTNCGIKFSDSFVFAYLSGN